jgi:hypothetical protein
LTVGDGGGLDRVLLVLAGHKGAPAGSVGPGPADLGLGTVDADRRRNGSGVKGHCATARPASSTGLRPLQPPPGAPHLLHSPRRDPRTSQGPRLAPIYSRRWKVKVRSPARLCRTAQASCVYSAPPTTSSPARPFGGPSRRIGWPAIYPGYPVPVAEDRSAGGGRDQTGPEPAVGPGSVSHRDHSGTNGRQRSPTAKRNRRSTSVQLKQQAQRQLADQIPVPKVGGSSPSASAMERGHPVRPGSRRLSRRPD